MREIDSRVILARSFELQIAAQLLAQFQVPEPLDLERMGTTVVDCD
ncbi:MAG: hypothetical protein AAF650_06930 [Pseudomonadota bacterium]